MSKICLRRRLYSKRSAHSSLLPPPLNCPSLSRTQLNGQVSLTRGAALKECLSGVMLALKTISDVVTGHAFAITSTLHKHHFWKWSSQIGQAGSKMCLRRRPFSTRFVHSSQELHQSRLLPRLLSLVEPARHQRVTILNSGGLIYCDNQHCDQLAPTVKLPYSQLSCLNRLS
jgi:hypothetical protein